MQNFAIGLSGLNAAQTALDVIGNNIANAATEGYHRQRVDLTPAASGQTASGVDVAGVTRLVDTFLESEITRQETSYSQVSQELSLLSTVETTLGEFSESGGLNATLDKFFDSLQSLAANPLERVPRSEVISAAETLSAEFRRLGASLKDMSDQVILEAQNTMDSISQICTQIAELNAKIQAVEVSQGAAGANNLCDQRDQLIVELAQLAGVETQPRDNGIVDVSFAGVPVVTGSVVLPLQISLQEDEALVVSAGGMQSGSLSVEGGKLGGLLALKNELLGGIRDELDTLAKAIVEEVNRQHVQGLGLDGSFRELTGWPLAATDLNALGTEVTNGTFYIRVTNTATGAAERYAITVDVSGDTPDTPDSLADQIDALDGVQASFSSSRFSIVAEQGYTFDFLPEVLTAPTATHLTAAAPPTVSLSGSYAGTANHVLTFTASANGSVGNDSLQLAVRDESGSLVGIVNIGQGYAAGETVTLSNGLQLALSPGNLNAGDNFQVQVLANADTSGFLAAAGMNAFFSGASASDMRVCSAVLDSPDRIAAALGRDGTDNVGALRLAALREAAVASLDGMTLSQYYQRTVADLGQQVALRQTRQDNVGSMLQSLRQQRSEVSAVNINDEAAQLLVFQQMFQGAAKYLSTLQQTMTTLLEMV